jgi:hypothetical protein
MAEKTLQELEALHQRLRGDVQRSTQIDRHGLTNNSPLVRNLRTVEEELRQRRTEKK